MNFVSTDPSITLLEDYYNHFDEDQRLLRRHGQVEFITAVKYVSLALNGDKTRKILDIGAGTGRYSIHFHEEGYDVTAVELVKRNIDVFRGKDSGVPIIQANAMDLSMFQDDSFDVVLLFGPMYHLLEKEEKLRALSEAKRVLKPKGSLFVSYYMNEYAVLEYGFVKHHILDAEKEGRLDSSFHTINKSGDLYSMVRLEDIDSFNETIGLRRTGIVSQDGPADYMRDALNRLSEEEFREFVSYHLSVCERKELLGAGSHLLDMLTKD